MKNNRIFVVIISLIVALGGFLLGFDSAVISGALPFYSKIFNIDPGSLLFGFSVSAITVGAIAGNIVAGPAADKFGRKKVLLATAFLFGFCALGSSMAHSIVFFISARLIGGFGVGMAILVAPMFIAEIAPRKLRGTLVSINQLNIVLGISVAFFSNYYILNKVTNPDLNWRWMLGIGAIPALVYFVLLFFIPQSPRWLVQNSRDEEAKDVLRRIGGEEYAGIELKEIEAHISISANMKKPSFTEVFSKKMKTVLIIGLGIAFFQQITGINSALYYATVIFNLTGIGNNASFIQAVLIGITNLVFTLVSMYLIDRLGRKPLLIIGGIGITISLSIVSFAFAKATYKLSEPQINSIVEELSSRKIEQSRIARMQNGLVSMKDNVFDNERSFFKNVEQNIGHENCLEFRDLLTQSSISIHALLVLIGLMTFVASFAISFGPVMWALLSEIFPNRLRGVAISLVGFFNSIVSTATITLFPISLRSIGTSGTYMIFAIFGLISIFFVLKYIPETKGKSLEELETLLVK
jgi:MFS family permease